MQCEVKITGQEMSKRSSRMICTKFITLTLVFSPVYLTATQLKNGCKHLLKNTCSGKSTDINPQIKLRMSVV